VAEKNGQRVSKEKNGKGRRTRYNALQIKEGDLLRRGERGLCKKPSEEKCGSGKTALSTMR